MSSISPGEEARRGTVLLRPADNSRSRNSRVRTCWPLVQVQTFFGHKLVERNGIVRRAVPLGLPTQELSHEG
jgi:hypothetical protein